MLAWAVASHYEAAPDEAEVTILPTYLVGGGAYAFTRNPMYVGGAAMQAGWAVLLGSFPVLAVGLGYVTALHRWGVPFEERLLRDRFGSSYDLYRQQVPRWLMPGRRSA
jgi:protein-S-isoprenylcysteine O-methyltransferase Ste14